MNRSISLLAILLVACDPGDGAGGGGDETGHTGLQDSGSVAADCVYSSLSPRTTSWDGGETISLSLDCANPGAVQSLQVAMDGVSVDASIVSQGDSVLEATFVAPGQVITGALDFDLDVDGETIPGHQLRYRVNPHELSAHVEVLPNGENLHWDGGQRRVIRSFVARSIKAEVRHLVDATESSVVVGGQDEDGQWTHTVLDAVPLEIQVNNALYAGGPAEGVSWSNEASGLQAVVLPVLTDNAGNPELGFAIAVDNGRNRRTEFKVLNFDHTPQGKINPDELSSKAPVVLSLQVDFDDEGNLSSLQTVIAVSNDAGGAEMVGMSYGENADGTQSWTQSWSSKLSHPVLHVSPAFTTSDGTPAVLAFFQGDVLETRLLALESGKELGGGTLEQVKFATLDIATAPLTQAEGDGLAIAVLDEQGAVFTGQLDYGSTTPFVVEGEITAQIRDWAEASIGGSYQHPAGNWSSPLSMRTNLEGDAFLALHLPKAGLISSAVMADETLLVASWLAGDAGANLGALPHSAELLAAGGQSFSKGSSGERVTGAPVIFNSTAYHTHKMGTMTPDASSELLLAGPAGWTLSARGGQVYAVDAEGVEFDQALPIDPSAALNADVVDGSLVVTGLVIREDADGVVSTLPGVVTAGPKGIGSAVFSSKLSGWDHDYVRTISVDVRYARSSGTFDGFASIAGTTAEGEDSYGVAIGSFAEGDLPGAGEENEIDLGLATFGVSSVGIHVRNSAAVWVPAGRVQSGVYDTTALADRDEVSTLAPLGSDSVVSDLIAVFPDDSSCGLATWFVPGTTTDPAENLGAAILLSRSDQEDCSGLAIPQAAIDVDGRGLSTVVMSQANTAQGTTDVWELIWDGASLLGLPALTTPPWERLDVADFDGDGLDEVLLHLGGERNADGTFDSKLSGLMLRGGGLHLLGPDIRKEVVDVKNAGDVAAGLPDGDGIMGAALELKDSGLDLLVVVGTQGGRHDNFTTVGVGNQPPPVLISSWGALLD